MKSFKERINNKITGGIKMKKVKIVLSVLCLILGFAIVLEASNVFAEDWYEAYEKHKGYWDKEIEKAEEKYKNGEYSLFDLKLVAKNYKEAMEGYLSVHKPPKPGETITYTKQDDGTIITHHRFTSSSANPDPNKQYIAGNAGNVKMPSTKDSHVIDVIETIEHTSTKKISFPGNPESTPPLREGNDSYYDTTYRTTTRIGGF